MPSTDVPTNGNTTAFKGVPCQTLLVLLLLGDALLSSAQASGSHETFSWKDSDPTAPLEASWKLFQKFHLDLDPLGDVFGLPRRRPGGTGRGKQEHSGAKLRWPAGAATGGSTVEPAQQQQQMTSRMTSAARAERRSLRIDPSAPMETAKLAYQGLLERRRAAAAGGVPTGKQALTKCLQRMAQQKKYGTYINLLTSSGWKPTLESYIETTPVTILAPTNAAFDALPKKYEDQLSNKTIATMFLQYHMLQQVWPFAALQYFRPSQYPTVLAGNLAWSQKTTTKKTPVSFGPFQTTPQAQQAPITDPDVSGTDLYLVVAEGTSKCMIPPGVFT